MRRANPDPMPGIADVIRAVEFAREHELLAEVTRRREQQVVRCVQLRPVGVLQALAAGNPRVSSRSPSEHWLSEELSVCRDPCPPAEDL